MRAKKNSNVVERVLRGGSYFDEPWDMSSTDRDWYGPEFRLGFDGFRLVIRRKA